MRRKGTKLNYITLSIEFFITDCKSIKGLNLSLHLTGFYPKANKENLAPKRRSLIKYSDTDILHDISVLLRNQNQSLQ